jgi:hypothetical protein
MAVSSLSGTPLDQLAGAVKLPELAIQLVVTACASPFSAVAIRATATRQQ